MGATIKCIVTDGGNAVGNINGGKTSTSEEGSVSDDGDTVGNSNGCKAGASVEGIVCDVSDTVGNINRGQSLAVIKSITTYACNGKGLSLLGYF